MNRADFDRCMGRLYGYFPSIAASLKKLNTFERKNTLDAFYDLLGDFTHEQMFEAGRYIAAHRRTPLYTGGFCAALTDRVDEVSPQTQQSRGKPDCEHCHGSGDLFIEETRDYILAEHYAKGSKDPWFDGRCIRCTCVRGGTGEYFIPGVHRKWRYFYGAAAWKRYDEDQGMPPF